MRPRGVATFLGGVAPDSGFEQRLAYGCGRVIGKHGLTLYHGGYNGLMECVAKGVAEQGGEVVAVTLQGKDEWGAFNPHVDRALYLGDFGQRMNTLLSNADIVIAMAGGVGTLHEVTAAIWYSGNVRKIPVVLMGGRAKRLLDFVKQDSWIYESPTRPIDFLSVVSSLDELDRILASNGFVEGAAGRRTHSDLERDLLKAALVPQRYVRADGTVLDAHFDPFRLGANPRLIKAAAIAIADQADKSIDAIVGVALGGVSLATLVAQVMQMPLAIIRPEPKPYGVLSQVEGPVAAGTRVLLIDDVVRTGFSMLKAQAALALVGISVAQAACLLRRGEGEPAGFVERGVRLVSLFSLPDSQKR